MLPLDQVGRAEQGVVVLLHVQGHDPALGLGVPHDLGVAVMADDVIQHGVAVVFRPAVTAVGAEGDALAEGFAFGHRRLAAGRGVDGHQRLLTTLLKAGGVVPIHHRGAGVHGAQLVRIEGDGELGPVHHVAADGVPPVHVSPVGADRVVLVEHVIRAAVVDQAVRVVVPAAPRREVELGPQALTVEQGRVQRLVGEVDPIERGAGRARVLEGQLRPQEGLEIDERLVVAQPVTESNVELPNGTRLPPDLHLPRRRPPVDRKDEVAPVHGNRSTRHDRLLLSCRQRTGESYPGKALLLRLPRTRSLQRSRPNVTGRGRGCFAYGLGVYQIS